MPAASARRGPRDPRVDPREYDEETATLWVATLARTTQSPARVQK
jgi:hypothetical protein